MPLFDPVRYYLPETLSSKRSSWISQALDSNGAQQAKSIDSATHIITNSSRFAGWQDLDGTAAVISDVWVERTLLLGELQPCHFYSVDPSMLFSGVVACPSGLSAQDVTIISAGVTALGGQWRNGLTRDVTHLLASSPDSEKYATALEFQKDTHIKILVPHWFDDCVLLGTPARLLASPYAWPKPTVLSPQGEVEGKKVKAERLAEKLSSEKRAFYKTAIWDPDKGGAFPGPSEPVGEKIWNGRKILLSPSLGLAGDRRRVIEEAVEAAGGEILVYASNNGDGDQEEEMDRVWECDVLVTRWRSGEAFFQAVQEGKVIGTLNWVFYVHATGILSSPMDQLLHYPVRRKPIEAFRTHQITVTNYTGEARDYLKRLIHTMGATFTAAMSGSNTILIAAHMGGIKTDKAQSWSIPIVNHTWLEDCFVQWRNLTPATPKYIQFPPNLDFAWMLGERGAMLTLDQLATEQEEYEAMRAMAPSERPPIGTEASAREVQGILNDDEGDVIMDDEDAMEVDGRLRRPRKPKPASGERVSSSISPTKRGHDEESEEPVARRPRRSGRRVLPGDDDEVFNAPSGLADGDAMQVDEAEPVAAKKKAVAKGKGKANGNSPNRANDLGGAESRTETMKKTAPKGKGKAKETHAQQLTKTKGKAVETELEDESDGARKSKAKGKGKEKEKQIKVNGKVMFVAESHSDGPSAGPSTGRLPKQPPTRAGPSTSMKRKAQVMESASNGDVAQVHESDSPPPRKRAKADDVATSSRPAAKKSSAGPGRDSALHNGHPKRTESLRALADERPSTAGGSGTKKRQAMVDSPLTTLPPSPKGPLAASKSKPKSKAGKKDTSANTSSGSRASRKSTTNIRLMTTQISLPEKVIKTLSKLGVKITTDISECTHLVAASIVRTEKFLSTLAQGAYILSDDWASESAAANKLLPENDYILSDKVAERRYKFRLVDAMARAKEVGGKLFDKKTFYVTPNVPIDTTLLRSVVTLQGGKVCYALFLPSST
ncbi:BRCT domain-containing protein [Mycena rebaudengoi]|nr:BRCT domain-containing protein [Mycena rebaudengoi]